MAMGVLGLALPWVALAQMNSDAPTGLYHRSAVEKGLGTMEVVPHSVAHRGEYVDAYSPFLNTTYGEVFWTMMEETPLPEAFVQRFANKTVAVTGYECDSVRILPDGSEEHVPIYDQYNHHHAAWVVGSGAGMVDLGPAGHGSTHGHGRWEIRDRPKTRAQRLAAAAGPPQSKVPQSVYLVDGNGGEYRMSLHGTHRGTAMMVESPATFRITPMMINTKHPQGLAPGQWGQDLIPSGAYGRSRGATPPTNAKGEPSSLYSPLLECPCTDRKPKVITQHNTLDSGHCAARLDSAAECFDAVAALGLLPITRNDTVSTATRPAGCSVVSTQGGYEALFNAEQTSTVECGASSSTLPPRSTGGAAVAGVEVSLDLDSAGGNCSAVTADLAGEWTCSFGCTVLGSKGTPYGIEITQTGPHTYTIIAHQNGGESGTATVTGSTVTMGGALTNWPHATISPDFLTWTFANGVVWKRPNQSCAGSATITLAGPADVWFGTGLDAHVMAKAYAIIVDGHGAVTERQLGTGVGVAGAHQPGVLLAPSVTVKSNTVKDGKRTVVLSRPLRGLTAQHATLVAAATGVPIIAAVGSTPTLSHHAVRGASDLFLVKAGAPTCVCQAFGSRSGTIGGAPFGNVCPPALLNDHQGTAAGNDVCDVLTYEGGLKCCTHGSILLDSNQTVPPQRDVYKMKFRIYYEEYTNQTEAFFMFQAIDAGTISASASASASASVSVRLKWLMTGGEYQVPQAKPGTPPEQRVHTVSQDFTVAETITSEGVSPNPVDFNPHGPDSQVVSVSLSLSLLSFSSSRPLFLSFSLSLTD